MVTGLFTVSNTHAEVTGPHAPVTTTLYAPAFASVVEANDKVAEVAPVILLNGVEQVAAYCH